MANVNNTTILEALNQLVQATNETGNLTINVSGGGSGGCGCLGDAGPDSPEGNIGTGDESDFEDCVRVHALIFGLEDLFTELSLSLAGNVTQYGFTLLYAQMQALLIGSGPTLSSYFSRNYAGVLVGVGMGLVGFVNAIWNNQIDFGRISLAFQANRTDLITSLSEYVNGDPDGRETWEVREFLALKLSSYGLGAQDEIMAKWLMYVVTSEVLQGLMSNTGMASNYAELETEVLNDFRYDPDNCSQEPI